MDPSGTLNESWLAAGKEVEINASPVIKIPTLSL
jgi:hypothetical protein